jgi:hypothetical protein
VPTALALVPNKRPKVLKKAMDEAGCQLFGWGLGCEDLARRSY